MYNNVSRTRMSRRNFTASIAGRLIGMITSFAGRGIFVKVLKAEYLGLGGFFGNIFSVVSLCELGIGAAVSQSLYKPLAENDEYKVSAIISFYSKVCKIVAVLTLVLSLIAFPFLPSIVKTSLDMKMINTAYLLFVLHSMVSYLLTPKCMLVVCDQRMYVVTLVRSVFSIVALALQSTLLVLTGNYIVYLTSRILVLVAEDLLINWYADKKYPCLSLRMKVSTEYKKQLFSNVKALMWHKTGGVLSRSTDSLLLTYFVGLAGMGKYSNYALVIGTIGAFFDVAVNAVGASVGNLGAVDRGKKSEDIMRKMYFVNFWMLTVGTSVIVSTLNPLIEVWLGRDMLFSNVEMLVIVSSFYFSCIRDPVQIFVSTYGLFKESKYIPVIRAAFNLVLSIVFVQKMGVAGVFLGTVLSTVLVPLFGEVNVLYKYGFSMKPSKFCREMLSYIAISCVCVAVAFLVTYNIKITLFGIVIRCISSFCASNAMLLLLSSGNEYFAGASTLFKKSLIRKRKSDF